jgi:hypothetical protein
MDSVELGEPDKVPAIYRAERAVVEAARALYAAEAYDVLRGNLQPAEKALAEAIEALERAEGET